VKEATGFRINTNEKSVWLKNVKEFKKLVDTRWNIG
jgi:hypothetical protein